MAFLSFCARTGRIEFMNIYYYLHCWYLDVSCYQIVGCFWNVCFQFRVLFVLLNQ
jgi:hypothetical protein